MKTEITEALVAALEASNMLLRVKRHACESSEICSVLDAHISRNAAALEKARDETTISLLEKTADGKPANHNLPVVLAIEAAEQEHGSLTSAAKALGFELSYLCRLKSGEKINPSDKVLYALGLERVTSYRAITCAAAAIGEQMP
ncbi:MAG: hypothetical protein CMK72_01240 [Pseudomonadaceae bacterium]|nr:hypothetical protein [Pseudomonadaceae bacterium]HCP54552.1 hypothetical protein [Pseudomonas sp.]|tara:strand:+ start:219 stop:653 length:435 start_codon:yes stop_codon:yes gene_type:complete